MINIIFFFYFHCLTHLDARHGVEAGEDEHERQPKQEHIQLFHLVPEDCMSVKILRCTKNINRKTTK